MKKKSLIVISIIILLIVAWPLGIVAILITLYSNKKAKGSITKSELPAIPPPSKNLNTDDDTDFKLLLGVFKKNNSPKELDVFTLVKKINPNSSNNVCPYCKTTHAFTASRARKCTHCNNKMIVRQGLFLTEKEAQQLEIEIQEFYKDQNNLYLLGSELEQAQRAKVQGWNDMYLQSMANAFRYAAIDFNQTDERGFDFWDKSWGYFNKTLAEKISDGELILTPGIHWEMTQTLNEQSESYIEPQKKTKWKRKVINHAFITIAETVKFDDSPFFISELFKMIKKIQKEFGISDDEIIEISNTVLQNDRLNSSQISQFKEYVKELLSFEIIR